MRKILLLAVALLIAAVSVQAQSRRISGRLIDRDTKEAVMQATIQLLKTDSTFVAGALSDERGEFHVVAPANGKYLLKLTSVGYEPIVKNVSLSGDKNVNLGDIVFGSDAIMLKGTTVTAQPQEVRILRMLCLMPKS